MSEVFLVTDGSYSDYRVVAVFDDEKLAVAFAEKGDMMVENYDLNPITFEDFSGRDSYDVSIKKNGDIHRVIKRTYCALPDMHFSNIGYEHDESGQRYTIFALSITCFATDEKHAIKIANEKRAQKIAVNEWPNPDQ